MMSSPASSTEHELRGEMETELNAAGVEDSDREISASSDDPLNRRSGAPPVPPPPPPPPSGAPPLYSTGASIQKPPEYHEAVGLLQANREEDLNSNPPPGYIELGEINRPDSRGAASLTAIHLENETSPESRSPRGSISGSVAAEEGATVAVPAVDVERGVDRIRARLGPLFDYVSQRRWLLIVMPMVLTAVIIFLAIFPVSFKYIHYHDIALKCSKLTGWVDFSRTYYSGCYVIGPEMEFIRFPHQAQHMSLTLSVTSSSSLSYTLHLVVVYRINATQLPELFRKFTLDYVKPMKAIVGSTVKNKAVDIHMDAWFLQRRAKEQEIEELVKKRLAPYHIDVTNVYLHNIVFPKQLLDRMMRRVMESIHKETAEFVLNQRVELKLTDKLTGDIRNSAAEVNANATAESAKIGVSSKAEALAQTEGATGQSLKTLKSNVSLTSGDQVLSYYFLSNLNKLAGKGKMIVATRNATKSYRRTTGTFSETLAVAAASLAKPKP